MNEIIIKVKGMACEGCENRIKNALSTIEGVEKVSANHTNGQVIVTLNKEVEEEVLKSKIEDLGFSV